MTELVLRLRSSLGASEAIANGWCEQKAPARPTMVVDERILTDAKGPKFPILRDKGIAHPGKRLDIGDALDRSAQHNIHTLKEM